MVSAGGAVVLALVDSLLRRIVLPLVLATGECVCIATEASKLTRSHYNSSLVWFGDWMRFVCACVASVSSVGGLRESVLCIGGGLVCTACRLVVYSRV